MILFLINLFKKLMDAAKLNTKPKFYKGMANNPRVDRIANSEVLFTNLPIIGELKKEVTVTFLGDFTVTFNHTVGRRCDFFARVRVKGVEAWTTLPMSNAYDFASFIEVTNITSKDITLLFESVASTTYELEIYFIDFTI